MREICRVLICAAVAMCALPGPMACAQDPIAQDPIAIRAELTAPEDGVASVVVSFEIEDGWHAYASTDAGNPSREMAVELELPDGVFEAGLWQQPDSSPHDDGSMLITGNGSFRRDLSITPADSPRRIKVTVAYQVCNEEGCMAPDEIRFDLTVAAEKPAFEYENEFFSTPEILMADGAPLNSVARQNYLSPGFHDVDNDGDVEFIIGDVAGRLRVYENTNQEEGEPVWSDNGYLLNVDGEDILARNW